MIKMRPRRAVFQFPGLRPAQRAAAVRRSQTLDELCYVTNRKTTLNSMMRMVGFPSEFIAEHVIESNDFGDLKLAMDEFDAAWENDNN